MIKVTVEFYLPSCGLSDEEYQTDIIEIISDHLHESIYDPQPLLFKFDMDAQADYQEMVKQVAGML